MPLENISIIHDSPMPTLVISQMSYPVALFQAWAKKDYAMLAQSAASVYLKETLPDKARRKTEGRENSWFFGEAFVAAHAEHEHGYYSSFKWLTNPRFIDDGDFPEGRTKEHHKEFRDALWRHFGHEQLKTLQKKAGELERMKGVRPVPPDLWLIDKEGNHRFIEVKLPADWVKPRQFAGLAVIACCLRAKTRISVEIIELHSDEMTFSEFCDALSGAPG